MDNQQLTRYVGDYDHFQEVYAVKKAQLEAAYQKQQQEISELKDFVARNKARVATRNMAMSRHRKLAQEESCIIIGRCADYVLDGTENLVRIFVYAEIEERINKVREKGYFPEEDILKNIKRIDRERRDYYRYYTGKSWENLENYDLMINTTKLSYDEMVECVIDYLKMRGLIAK